MIKTKNISQFVVDTYDKNSQDLILIEEMSELTKELLKKRRGKDNREQIIEEMAHVYISLNVVKNILNITDNEINNQIELKENKVMKFSLAECSGTKGFIDGLKTKNDPQKSEVSK